MKAHLAAKAQLAVKGESKDIHVKAVDVFLRWTSKVDLDLMLFYKTKFGKEGAIFTNLLKNGSLGSKDSFPFIKHDGDEGVGNDSNDKESCEEEHAHISHMDHMKEIYIIALDYTDASSGKETAYNKYDAGVVIKTEKGQSVSIPLNATEPGNVAIVAKIDHVGGETVLHNVNEVMSLSKFGDSVPGARLLVHPNEEPNKDYITVKNIKNIISDFIHKLV